MRNAAKDARTARAMSCVPTAAYAGNVWAVRVTSATLAPFAKTVWITSAQAAALAVPTVPPFARIVMKNALTAPMEKFARNAANALTVLARTASA